MLRKIFAVVVLALVAVVATGAALYLTNSAPGLVLTGNGPLAEYRAEIDAALGER